MDGKENQDLQYCEAVVDRFSKLKILVIGDFILDQYIWGDVNRICPEAPVPVVEVRKQTKVLGGAGNVVKNILALGGKCAAVGVIGADESGQYIQRSLRQEGLEGEGVIVDDSRPTSIKTRIIGGSQQIVRFDCEVAKEISDNIREAAEAQMAHAWKSSDAVIISDYGKGVIGRPLMERVRSLCEEEKKIVLVDPIERHMDLYKGMTVVTPNKKEAFSSVSLWSDDLTLAEVGKRLLDKLCCQYLVITLGAEGMAILQAGEGNAYKAIPTFAKEVFDVSGAGDTAVSTLALALAGGAPIEIAAFLANLAAGVVVGKLGTATVSAQELKRAWTPLSNLKEREIRIVRDRLRREWENRI